MLCPCFIGEGEVGEENSLKPPQSYLYSFPEKLNLLGPAVSEFLNFRQKLLFLAVAVSRKIIVNP